MLTHDLVVLHGSSKLADLCDRLQDRVVSH
jgi:hypothetical protein